MEVERVDRLLLPFVRASDEAESDQLLSSLITEHAEPIITKIVRYKTRATWNGDTHTDAEDICGEVMLQLVQRLQNFRADYETRPISDFNAYVAVTTYNAFDRYVSRKYPQRRRLKNGLRYLLTHRKGFDLWQTRDDIWVGGFARWRDDAETTTRDENRTDKTKQADDRRRASVAADETVAETDSAALRLQQLREDNRAFARGVKAQTSWHDPKHGYELLSALFEWTNHPVELDLLTSVVAEWWNVTDEIVEIDAAGFDGRGESAGAQQIADQRSAVSVETEQRIYLKKLWDEIKELPPRQRAALLFNLRDDGGRGIVDLWIIVGVATAEQMAASLSLTTEQFAELWSELPLDDNRIAALLNLTRQQVINLRKSARERLVRRVKAF